MAYVSVQRAAGDRIYAAAGAISRWRNSKGMNWDLAFMQLLVAIFVALWVISHDYHFSLLFSFLVAFLIFILVCFFSFLYFFFNFFLEGSQEYYR